MKSILLLLLSAIAAPPAEAKASIQLGNRQAAGIPARQGFTHTGGGNIDVQQPAPDTVVVTMTGVAVAGAHPCQDSAASLALGLLQDFEVTIDKPNKMARVTLEARVIGLLRSHAHGGGSAGIDCAHASVVPCGPGGGPALLSVVIPGRSVSVGENASVNDRQGPDGVVVAPGRFALHQKFCVQAAHPKRLLPCKTASAEFAPDPALDPLWISAWEPFRGAAKKDFGFQVILKVAAE